MKNNFLTSEIEISENNMTNRNNHLHQNDKRKLSEPVNNENLNNSESQIGEFLLGKTLGKGTFGKVKLGKHIKTGERAAIKILEKIKLLDDTDKTRIEREIKILKSTFHHNIVKIYSVIESRTKIYLVTEYCEGGELFNYINIRRRLSEVEACKYFHQIIDAVDYLHKIGICHRDLKPENMLLDYNKDLKIIDFGLSNLYHPNELLKSACGSPGYASPEMIKGCQYDGLLSDLWSCGIILYAMLVGYLPFDDPSEMNLYEKIIKGKFVMPHYLSENSKDLIKKILNTNPNKRIDIKGIRNHPWYNMFLIPKIEGLFVSIHPIPIDNYVIETIVKLKYDKKMVIKSIIENKHNDITTLYYLLIKKYSRKGIGSISDLISGQFTSYLNRLNKKNKSPKFLIEAINDSNSPSQHEIKSFNPTNKNFNINSSNTVNSPSEVNFKKINTYSNNNYDECITEVSENKQNNILHIKEKINGFKLFDENNKSLKANNPLSNKLKKNITDINNNNVHSNRFTLLNYENKPILNTCENNNTKETKIINFQKIFRKKPFNFKNQNDNHYLIAQLKTQYNKIFRKNEFVNMTDRGRNSKLHNKEHFHFKKDFLVTSTVYNKLDKSFHNNTFTSGNCLTEKGNNNKMYSTNNNNTNINIKRRKQVKSTENKHNIFFSLPKQKYKDNFLKNSLQTKNTNNILFLNTDRKTNKLFKNYTPTIDISKYHRDSKKNALEFLNTEGNKRSIITSNDKANNNKQKNIYPKLKPPNKMNLKIFLNNNYNRNMLNNIKRTRNRELSSQNQNKYNNHIISSSKSKTKGSPSNLNFYNHNKSTEDILKKSTFQKNNKKIFTANNIYKDKLFTYNNIVCNTHRNRSAEKHFELIPNYTKKKLLKYLDKNPILEKKNIYNNKTFALNKNNNFDFSTKNKNGNNKIKFPSDLPMYNEQYDISDLYYKSLDKISELIYLFLTNNDTKYLIKNNKLVCNKGALKFNIELYKIQNISNGIYLHQKLINGDENDFKKLKNNLSSTLNK